MWACMSFHLDLDLVCGGTRSLGYRQSLCISSVSSMTGHGSGYIGYLGPNFVTTLHSRVRFELHPFRWSMAQSRRPSARLLRVRRVFWRCRLRYRIMTNSFSRCVGSSNKHNSSTSTSMTASIGTSPSPSANGFGSA
jgi:hypothetical protein